MDIQIVSLNQRSNCLNRNPQFSGSFSKASSFHSLLRFYAKRKNNTIRCAMKSYRLSELSKTEVDCLKARPRIDFSSIFSTVQPIVDDVRNRGDAAVTDYTSRFDKVSLDKIIEQVADLPDPQLDPAVKEAFDVAYDNIYAFHYAQKAPPVEVENMKGVRCKRVSRCITSVGLYVPGGTAVLPSTALMLAVPAQIAGCKIVVLATPPAKDGSICKEVLYCAKKAGVTHILKAGGAQAMPNASLVHAYVERLDRKYEHPSNEMHWYGMLFTVENCLWKTALSKSGDREKASSNTASSSQLAVKASTDASATRSKTVSPPWLACPLRELGNLQRCR